MGAESGDVRYEHDIEIHESRAKLAVGFVGCGLGSALFFSIATGVVSFDSMGPFIVWLCAVTLGLCAVAALRRLIHVGKPVVKMTGMGLEDRRLFSGTLQWKDIQGMGIVTIQRRSYLGLRVAPEVKRSLGMTGVNRFMSMLAFELPKDLLAVNVALMKTDLETLRMDLFRKAAASGVLLRPYDGDDKPASAA